MANQFGLADLFFINVVENRAYYITFGDRRFEVLIQLDHSIEFFHVAARQC
ncbi:Uncharacterised protein [Vibrio cholerae]|nr:Uncharacterised protein [Vibrio cholerae]